MKLYIAILFSTLIVWLAFGVLLTIARLRVVFGQSVSKDEVAEIRAAEATYYEQNQHARHVKTVALVWYQSFQWLAALTIGMNFWFASGIKITQVRLFLTVLVGLVVLTTISFVGVLRSDRQFRRVLAATELKVTLPESTNLDIYSTWFIWMTMVLVIVSAGGIAYALTIFGV